MRLIIINIFIEYVNLNKNFYIELITVPNLKFQRQTRFVANKEFINFPDYFSKFS